MTIDEAKELAMFFHEGQTRADGVTPYVEHPIAVANLVKEKLGSDDMICIALLHDVIEEAEKKVAAKYGYEPKSKIQFLKKMRKEWGSEIAFGVCHLTDSWDSDMFIIAERGKVAYLGGLFLNASSDIVLIKLCDMVCNMRESNGSRLTQEKRYYTAVQALRIVKRRDLDARHESLMTEIEALYNIHNSLKK